jgi:Tfp pilus assembly protein PilO
MPFDIEADGPYFSVLDFFARLGRLSRIINVGDLKLSGLSGGTTQNVKFHTAPGASVTGTFTITTFFTKAADAGAAAPAAAPANKAAAGQKR